MPLVEAVSVNPTSAVPAIVGLPVGASFAPPTRMLMVRHVRSWRIVARCPLNLKAKLEWGFSLR